MALQLEFSCPACGDCRAAWDEANPYYIDETGQKRYAFHPDEANLRRCVGNDTPFICMDCAQEFNVDSRHPVRRCPHCASETICETFGLKGKRCVKCRKARYRARPGAIS